MRKTIYNITYQIYEHKKLKNKVSFFGKDVNPIYIRITYRTKSLNFKSHYFDHLLKAKYQNSIRLGNKAPSLSDIIMVENDLILFLINKHHDKFSLALFKTRYDIYGYDLLDNIDENYKQFLIQFFTDEKMPLVAYLLENVTEKLTADIIMEDVKKLVSTALYDKILTSSKYQAPHYIPLLEFYRKYYSGSIKILLAYHLYLDHFEGQFNSFIGSSFPDYSLDIPYQYLNNYVNNATGQWHYEAQ